MRLARALEKLMTMNEAAWERHANAWSGWTRLPILPLIVLALWFRDWLGAWTLPVIAALVIWTWYNPRAFAPPKSTDNWMSKVTFGERIWLRPQQYSIPAHHARAARAIGAVSTLGILPLAYGLWSYELWAVAAGLVTAIGGKFWFMDRMVWLYEDVCKDNPDVRAWVK